MMPECCLLSTCRGAAGLFVACFALLTGVVVDSLRAAEPAAATKSDDEYPRETLARAGGCNLSLADARGRAATVLVCMSIECPISNEYLPTIKRLAEEYRARGVNVIGINPNAGETLEAMAA